MKSKLFLLIVMVSLVFFLSFSPADDGEKEKKMITQVALDYIEGFYEGNAERMERALHPEFHKKGINLLKDTGKNMLSGAGFSKMVELTRLGIGKKVPKDKRNIKVFILDIYKNTASVKTISAQYMDYLHMVKFNGTWKILNVLWEPSIPGKH